MSDDGFSFRTPKQPWTVPLNFDCTDLPDQYLDRVLHALHEEGLSVTGEPDYVLLVSVLTVPVDNRVDAITYAFGRVRSVLHAIENVSTHGWPERTMVRDLYKDREVDKLPIELVGHRIGYLPPTPNQEIADEF